MSYNQYSGYGGNPYGGGEGQAGGYGSSNPYGGEADNTYLGYDQRQGQVRSSRMVEQ